MKVYKKRKGVIFEKPRSGDAGYDLRSSETLAIKVGKVKRISTGVHVRIPENHVGLIRERSSTGFNLLTVRGGVIDPGYTGEIKVQIFYPRTFWDSLRSTLIEFVGTHVAKRGAFGMAYDKMVEQQTYTISEGDKIAQLLIVPCVTPELEFVTKKQLGQSERGEDGFGSTGQK